MNGKTVLFICNYYAPDATIAAVRTTKLVKYLSQAGYRIDFLATENHLDVDETLLEDAKNIQVKRAQNSESYLRKSKRIKNIIAPIKERCLADMSNRYRRNPKTGHIEFYPYETAYPALGSIDYLLNQKKQKDFFKDIRTWLDEAPAYDYMITSYGDAFCYYAGMYYHKNHPETKWICDIRDAILRYKFTPKYVSFIPKRMEQKLWKNADVITGISQGICDRVPKEYRDKVHKVTNGYDPDDRVGIVGRTLSTEKLVLTYTGSMYGGIRDLTPLFRAIRSLIDEGAMLKEKVEYHFAGTESAAAVFKRQLAQYELEESMICHGMLSRRQTLELQQSSDALLVSSYDYENNKGGVITGKFYEYMSANRPLIVVVVGDIRKSEIAEMTRRCACGIAYEEAHDDTDYALLKDYVYGLYKQRVENRNISFFHETNEVEKYSYPNIVKQLTEIMESMEETK